jgi:sortase A
MKKHGLTISLLIMLFVGVSLILYPSVANYWNSMHASKVIDSYNQQVEAMSDEECKQLLEDAYAFNERLANSTMSLALTDAEREKYYNLLGSEYSIMGYITISKINCVLPIYHGTDESVLGMGVGHLEGSSLPVGGESTHCVLSGHRGLPSARLFTDLDQLTEGDVFTLNVLKETLTYEVDQIRIVEPEDVSELSIVAGEDYCTLVTCTPYGVNTQRLLVRGHRIENLNDFDATRITADAIQIEPILVAPFAAIPILVVMLLWVFHTPSKNKSKRRKHRKDDSET